VQNLDVAGAGRITIWQLSVTNWSKNPVAGVGLGNTGEVGFAHNFVLETLVELGLLGLLFLLMFLIITVANLVRLRSVNWQDQTFYLVVTGLFVYSLVQGSFSGRIQTLTMLWIAAGMVNALIVCKSGSPTLQSKAGKSI
jgi:O-antigen ligase